MGPSLDDVGDSEAPSGSRYYRGTIRRLFASSGMGLVLSDSGREIPFMAAHVVVIGEARRFEDLREGMLVGFDVGWTSKGLRVTVLHVGLPGDAPTA
jgi:hypothetical protein